MEWPTNSDKPARSAHTIISEHDHNVSSKENDMETSNSLLDMLDLADLELSRRLREQQPCCRHYLSSSTHLFMGAYKLFSSYYHLTRKHSKSTRGKGL